MRSAEYQRGYDAGYKQALLDAIRKGGPPTEPDLVPVPRPNKPLSGGTGMHVLYKRLGDTSSPTVRERLRRHGLIP